MTRLDPLNEAALTADQRAVVEALRSGPRARQGQLPLVGPFGVWVRSPTIGHAVQAMGAVARFNTALPERVKEIAICVVGAHYRAKFEFAAHSAMAIAAGVAPAAVEAIRTGRDPGFLDAADIASYRVASELLLQHRVSDATFADAKDRFGESGMIELVSVIGYYCLVSLTLNAFEIPVTERMTDPFPD